MSEASTYIPGVCNINPVEIRKRRMAGRVGVVITVVLSIALLALREPWYLSLLVFFPAFMAATGYLQAHNHFCVGFASAGKQNADKGGQAEIITDKKALALDKKKTQRMNLQAAGIAAAVTAVVIIIGFLI